MNIVTNYLKSFDSFLYNFNGNFLLQIANKTRKKEKKTTKTLLEKYMVY